MSWNFLNQSAMHKLNEIMEQIKVHDMDTFNHCVRVSQLCCFLADAAGMPEEERALAQLSGLLHDVGKAKIPLNVLNKPGQLNDEEYNLVQKHAFFSAEMIEPLAELDQFFREVQIAVLHHHERVDGAGYPLQLQGEELPHVSRLILVVDTVDAMGQNRAYRKGLPLPVIYDELVKCSGKQFDAELVKTFIAAHKKVEAEEKKSVVKLPWLELVA